MCPDHTEHCVFTLSRSCTAPDTGNQTQTHCALQLSEDADGSACTSAGCTYAAQGNCSLTDQASCTEALLFDTDGSRCLDLKCVYGVIADGVGENPFMQEPCFSSPCAHEGICSEVNATSEAGEGAMSVGAMTFNCSCPPEWTGSQCEIFVDGCVSNPCLHDGMCISRFFDPALPPGGYRCVCDYYYPQSVDYNCATYFDECTTEPCQNGATCLSSYTDLDINQDDYVCVCTKDWSGVNCTTGVTLLGCTDSRAINFDPMANLEEGTCTYSTQLVCTPWTFQLCNV